MTVKVLAEGRRVFVRECYSCTQILEFVETDVQDEIKWDNHANADVLDYKYIACPLCQRHLRLTQPYREARVYTNIGAIVGPV